MQHLDTVQDSQTEQWRIPLVINQQYNYDGGTFLQYPYRCGMAEHPDTTGLESLNLGTYHIDDLAPFLQAWLYFGLLHTIFKDLAQTDYELEDFVYQDEDYGGRFVTTKNLNL